MAALVAVGIAFFALFCQFARVVDFRRVFRVELAAKPKAD
jgi:hypothetical protein